MPTDEQLSLEILLCIVAVVISFGCHQPCATRLSFNCKKQFDMLFDEYTRLGQPLKDPSVTLTTIVDRVDIELSRMQTYVIQSADVSLQSDSPGQLVASTWAEV